MTDRVTHISNEAIAKATGKTWSEWSSALDLLSAASWNHKALVDFLAATYHLSPWWCQTVTMHYERMHRQRVVGQTATAGFQIGVQHTLALAQSHTWDFLTSDRGMALWLGEISLPTLAVGSIFTTTSGITGTFRIINPPQHLRLTWQPLGWATPSALQIRVVPVGSERVSIRFHHEQLANAAIRNQMRQHWREVLTKVTAEVLNPTPP